MERKSLKKRLRKSISLNLLDTEVAKEGEASSQGGRQAGGGSYASDTYTHMAVAIDGVDSEDFIGIMDNAYTKFVNEIKAQGYEIISPDVAGTSKYYEGWDRKKGGAINSGQMNGYLMATPNNFEYYVKKTSKKGKEKSTFVDNSMKLSKELDDAIIAKVTFAFPTIKMKTSGGAYSFNGSSVKATIDFRIAPLASDGSAFGQPAYTKVTFIQGKGPGISAQAIAVTSIKSDISIEGFFADTKFKERTAKKVTQASSNPGYYNVVFTDSQSTAVTHTAAADHDAYVSKSNQIIDELLDASLADLKEKAGN